jgi:hypothetical protein
MMRFLFRKRFKQSLKRSFGLFVVFAMVLQSVGLPGLTTIVLASEGNEQSVGVVEEEKNNTSQEEESAKDTKEKEVAPSEETESEQVSDEDSSEEASSEETSSDSDKDSSEEERSSDYNVVSEGEELNFEEGKGVILDTAVSTEREVSDEDSQEEESEEEKSQKESDDTEEDASKWTEDAKERGYDIIEVEEDETYEYGGKGFSIRFTDIDEDVDEAYRIIAIKEVTLTEKQQEALGAMSDIAYDVISPMENESFSYELTLPTPEGSDEDSVEIVYAEDEESLNDSKKVKSVEKETVSVEDGGKKTKVKDLDHFTIFVAVGTKTSTFPEASDAVVINAFLFDPVTGSEWIELYNKDTSSTDITNWKLCEFSSAGNENCSTISATSIDSDDVIIEEISDLNNEGATITLKDDSGFAISQVTYSDNGGDFSIDAQDIGEVKKGNIVVRTEDGGTNWEVDTSVYVDASHTGNEYGTEDFPFNTIQEGINAVGEGGTVFVSQGTYTEGLTINKSLSLLGPNADVSPNTETRGNEATIEPVNIAAITGSASDVSVVFKGFEVDMSNTEGGDRFMNQTGKSNTEWTFEHNIFKNANYSGSGHWLINGNSPGLVFNLYDNFFTGNEVSNGISIWDSNPMQVNVLDNVWEDNGYTAMNLNNAHGTISGNTFRDTREIDVDDPDFYLGDYQSGLLLANPNFDLDITDNVFSNVYYGISFYQNVDGFIEISGNTFDGTVYTSVRASSSQPEEGTNLDGVEIFENKFINYAGDYVQVSNVRTDDQVLNAENNWWGSAEFEDIAPEISGEVDYDPWCVNEDCTESTEEEYSEAETQELSTTAGDDVEVGYITIKDPKTNSGDGSIRVAKYESEPESGGIGLGVEGFYYSIETSGDVTFPIDIEIAYSDDTEADNYLDEDKFISLYYYDEDDSEWKDYRNDDPASTVNIDKDANVISASLLHLTPIVPVVDVESPTVADVKLNNEDVTSTHIRDNNCDAIQNFYPVKGVIDFNAVIEDNLTDVVSADFTIRKVNSSGCTQTGIYKSGKVNMTEGADDRWSGSFDTTSISNDGEYTIQLITKDGAGNQTMKYVDILVDNTNPTIANPAISKNVVKNSDSPVLSADVDGTNSNVLKAQYRIHKSDGSKVDGFGWVDMDATDGSFDSEEEGVEKIVNTTGLSDGSYIARIRAFDSAGNKKSGVDVPFTVDNTNPAVSDVMIDDQAITSTHIRDNNCDAIQNFYPVKDVIDFSAVIEDNLTDVVSADFTIRKVNSGGCTQTGIYKSGKVNMTEGADDRWSGSFDTNVIPADGEYTIQLITKDGAGNETMKYVDILVDNTAPEVPTGLQYKTLSGEILGCDVFTNQQDVVADWDDSSEQNFSHYEYRAFNFESSTPWETSVYGASERAGAFMKGDGLYGFAVRAVDLAGNASEWTADTLLDETTCQITYDTIPPEVALTSPTEGFVSGTVSVSGTVTDVNPHHYHLVVKDGSGATIAGPGTVGYTNNFSGTFFDWDTTSVADGEYEIRLSARDAADNKDNSVSRVIRMVTVDNTAPTTTDDVDGVWRNGDVTVNLTCVDDGSGCDETYYATDGSDPTTSSSSGNTFAISDEGEHTIKYFSVDNLGNTESVKTAESQVRIDLTDPESTIDGAGNNEVIYASTWDGNVSGTASDNLSGVEKVMLTIQRGSDSNYWNGVSWQGAEVQVEATGTTTWSYALGALPEDSYTITSRATDNAGNVENTYSITIVYDKTIPEVVLTIDPSSPDGDNGWYVSTPEITLSASDNFDLERIEYKFDGDTDWSVYTEPVSVLDGERTFSYRAIDKADNVSDTGTKFVKVDTEEPNEVDDITVEYNDGVIELRWDTDDSDIHDVYLYRGREKTFSKDRHSLTAKIDGDEDEYDDDNVEPGDKLYYKLMSRDEAGNTSDSKIVSVEIPEEEGGEIIVVDEGIDTAPAGDVAGDATENETLTEEGLTQEESSEEGSEEGNDGQGNTSNEEGVRDEDDNGEVLGEEVDAQTQGLSTFTWLVILAGGGLLGAWLFRMAKKKGFIG